MKTILRIGEFSKMNQISIETLRFYDQIGLLKPHTIDPDTKYRYYHISQSSIVDSIQYLRQLDFSLEAIKEILSDKDTSHLHQLIDERYQKLLRERETLDRQIKEIEVFRSGALLYRQKKSQKQLELLHFPKRQMLTFELDKNIYQMKQEEYEVYLHYFKQNLFNYHPFFHHFSRVGSLMKKADFQQQHWYSRHFLLFQDNPSAFPTMEATLLPAGTYAVSYCDSFEDEIYSLPDFHQAIMEANLQIVGDYICEVIHEQPQIKENQRDMFIRMQIQVDDSRKQ